MDEQQIIRLQSSIINRLNSEQGDVFADLGIVIDESVKIQTELRNLEEEMNDIINLEPTGGITDEYGKKLDNTIKEIKRLRESVRMIQEYHGIDEFGIATSFDR
jgi:phage host-nuclease inhibitor protein Gam